MIILRVFLNNEKKLNNQKCNLKTAPFEKIIQFEFLGYRTFDKNFETIKECIQECIFSCSAKILV